MHEGVAHLAEIYPRCFCQPRQPLKIGIRIIARHPEIPSREIHWARRSVSRSLTQLEPAQHVAIWSLPDDKQRKYGARVPCRGIVPNDPRVVMWWERRH